MLIRIRRDTAAVLAAANPTPQPGELIAETDTGKVKLGDGVTAWATLPYLHDQPTATTSATAATVVESSTVTGQANPQYLREANGHQEWGVGVFGTDTYLERGAAPGLQTATDLEITATAAGLILTDRVTATRYRLKIASGTLGVEAA